MPPLNFVGCLQAFPAIDLYRPEGHLLILKPNTGPRVMPRHRVRRDELRIAYPLIHLKLSQILVLSRSPGSTKSWLANLMPYKRILVSLRTLFRDSTNLFLAVFSRLPILA